jgi:predicted transposase YbfD/YdcC
MSISMKFRYAVTNQFIEPRPIPVLLELLEINGCIVTIDAMGCQTDIAEKIVEKKAGYVLAVKDNQKRLHEAISDYFEVAVATDSLELADRKDSFVNA